MKRQYTKVKHLESEILAKKAKGQTSRELGLEYGLTKRQVEGIIVRHNQRKKREASGIPGRAKRAEQSELEYLRMENELLRDFIRLVEGK